jgi:hypothetical protein
VKYMLLVIGFNPSEGPTASGEASEEGPSVEEFMAYERSLVDAGVRVDGSALHGIDTATSVQVGPGGEQIITNGPFAETREYLGGYDIIDVPDLDAALEWATRCPGAKYGRVEVRPLLSF